MGGTDIRDGNARRKGDIDIIFSGRRSIFRQIGSFHPAVLVRILQQTCIARADYRGENKLIGALRGSNQLCVKELDAHIVAGHDICHVHGEHVRALLLEQRGAFPFAFRLLIFRLCLLLFLNLGGDNVIADNHLHSMDGDACGSGKDIAGVYGRFSFIGVGLSDCCRGNNAVNIR